MSNELLNLFNPSQAQDNRATTQGLGNKAAMVLQAQSDNQAFFGKRSFADIVKAHDTKGKAGFESSAPVNVPQSSSTLNVGKQSTQFSVPSKRGALNAAQVNNGIVVQNNLNRSSIVQQELNSNFIPNSTSSFAVSKLADKRLSRLSASLPSNLAWQQVTQQAVQPSVHVCVYCENQQAKVWVRIPQRDNHIDKQVAKIFHGSGQEKQLMEQVRAQLARNGSWLAQLKINGRLVNS